MGQPPQEGATSLQTGPPPMWMPHTILSPSTQLCLPLGTQAGQRQCQVWPRLWADGRTHGPLAQGPRALSG